MNICFLGMGSMGVRHLNNMVDISNLKHQSLKIDVLRSSKRSLDKNIENKISNSYYSIDDLPKNYDIIFITNPTYLHYNSIKKMVKKTNHMFIEKPIFDHLDYSINQLNLKKEGIYYVACPLRYTTVIQYLKKYIENINIFAVRSICSSYLPDWRPNVDYQKTYSAHKDMGGGVRIDIIHEWDYLSFLFGLPIGIKSFSGKYSNLKISSEDIAVYIAQYEQMLLSLHLDYIGREPKRQIELYTDKNVVIADLLKSEIYFSDSNKTIDLKEDRDTYQKRELNTFLNMTQGLTPNTNDIERAFNVMKIALSDH